MLPSSRLPAATSRSPISWFTDYTTSQVFIEIFFTCYFIWLPSEDMISSGAILRGSFTFSELRDGVCVICTCGHNSCVRALVSPSFKSGCPILSFSIANHLLLITPLSYSISFVLPLLMFSCLPEKLQCLGGWFVSYLISNRTLSLEVSTFIDTPSTWGDLRTSEIVDWNPHSEEGVSLKLW